ncbi:MAG: hypothetical protein FOGNACKC_03437 [Anaerolineae bacterium]|nr:hypothetical protein [Anaerolineae bacterium]
MPSALVDPEELEKFAQDLKRFNEQLRDSMSNLNGRFGRLGDTWRDQEHRKFAQEYQQTVRALDRFMQASSQQIPLLLRKAAIIRQYLNR